MNYTKHYQALIVRALNREISGYTEKHHIVPRCMGGSDCASNLVVLTPEEHYLAHQLLVKIYPNQPALVYAAAMMTVNRPSNKLYGWLKRSWSKTISENQKGSGNSQAATRWITNGILNRKQSIDEPVPENWRAGRVLPQRIIKRFVTCPCGSKFETSRPKAKYCSISCSSKNKPPHIHSDSSRLKMSISAKSRINNSANTVWITDGDRNKRISSTKSIPSGWHLGRSIARVSPLSTKQE